VDQRIAEVKYALEGCDAEGVPYEQVFKPRQGSAAPAAGNDTAAAGDASPTSPDSTE